jgi:hypothetical protein
MVWGLASTGNTIRGNSIHSNDGLGIDNYSGGNGELTPPVIVAVSPISGTACANCTVDVYSDDFNEGRIYEGSTEADGGGNWTFWSGAGGPFVTATATDAGGNTSEFSAPFACLSGCGSGTPTPTPTPSPSPTPTPSPTPSPIPVFDPVGGIAMLPDIAEGGSSSFGYVPLSALAAAVVVALAGGAWYARRRSHR